MAGLNHCQVGDEVLSPKHIIGARSTFGKSSDEVIFERAVKHHTGHRYAIGVVDRSGIDQNWQGRGDLPGLRLQGGRLYDNPSVA